MTKEEILGTIEYLQQRTNFANYIGAECIDNVKTDEINLAIKGLEELLRIKYNETSF